MPAERPGTLPSRSSCVPCGRSWRLGSPGDAPRHHPPRDRYIPQLSGKDSVTATPSPSVAVTSMLVGVSGGLKQKKKGPSLSGGATKAPVASVGKGPSTNVRPSGKYTSVSVIGLLGVKPVPEIVPLTASVMLREMSGVGTGTSCPPLAAYLVHCPSFLNGFPLASV